MSAEPMYEYTLCPGSRGDGGPCGSLVRIWGGTGINYCCAPCWETSWALIQLALQADEPVAIDQDFGHSDQCDARQKARYGQEVVTGRDWQIMGKVPGGA